LFQATRLPFGSAGRKRIDVVDWLERSARREWPDTIAAMPANIFVR
jgi:hypothetical protein